MTDYSEGFAKFVREREKAAESHAEYGRAAAMGPWFPPETPDEVVLGSKPPRVIDEDAADVAVADANLAADKTRMPWPELKAEVVAGKVVGPVSAPRDALKEMVLKRRDEVVAEIQRSERPPVTPDAVANAILARLAALPERHPARLKYEEVRQRLMDAEVRRAHEDALLECAATHFEAMDESARLAPSVVTEWLRGRIWEAK